MQIKPKVSIPGFLVALLGTFWVVQTANLWLDIHGTTAIISILVFVLVLYAAFNRCTVFVRRKVSAIYLTLENASIEVLLGGVGGLLLGIIIGLLSAYPLSMLKGPGVHLMSAVFFICGLLGVKLGTSRAYDLAGMLSGDSDHSREKGSAADNGIKVLDTSAIIDGRIYDVCQSSFIDGPLVVPTFVIEELQHIADSSDQLRRNKGRRGLELLSKMQKHPHIKIDIIEADIPEEKEVDGKLIRLCKQLSASIVTNDYNLNKVSELQGIKVLNINELANAVKVIVYPGENMHVNIIKEGKELGQGVGYLEDGTMVVVEDAQGDIGRDLDVVVTSVFQTAAGRMIFTRKNKDEQGSHAHLTDNTVQKMREVNVYG